MTARAMTAGSALSSDEWCTPKWLCELLGRFDLDPCWNGRSSVNAVYRCSLAFDREDWDACEFPDGLEFNWDDYSVYCNPPYSNVMPWAGKLAAHEGPWCALLKNDPTTRWWAALMAANPIVAPFRKRIKFEGDKAMTANFPSVLVFKRWWPNAELIEHLWIARYA